MDSSTLTLQKEPQKEEEEESKRFFLEELTGRAREDPL